MLPRISSQCIVFMAIALLVASVSSAQQPPPEPAVAPEVIAALEKMGGFLRTLKAFTVRADTDIDEVLADSGQKIQLCVVMVAAPTSADEQSQAQEVVEDDRVVSVPACGPPPGLVAQSSQGMLSLRAWQLMLEEGGAYRTFGPCL